MSFLHPSWVAAFNANDEAAKSSMVSGLVCDWLASGAGPVDHCAALLELLASARGSAARRNLIEKIVAEKLASALAFAPTQLAAAKAADRLLLKYEPFASVLTSELCELLQLQSAQRERLAPLLHDGLERLASTSSIARHRVFPPLFEQACATLTGDGLVRSFGTVKTAFVDLSRLRGCLEVSPYHESINTAFG